MINNKCIEFLSLVPRKQVYLSHEVEKLSVNELVSEIRLKNLFERAQF